MTRLFVGSEGTLGFVTKAHLKLTRTAQNVKVAIAQFETIENAIQMAVNVIQSGHQLECMEFLDGLHREQAQKSALVGLRPSALLTPAVNPFPNCASRNRYSRGRYWHFPERTALHHYSPLYWLARVSDIYVYHLPGGATLNAFAIWPRRHETESSHHGRHQTEWTVSVGCSERPTSLGVIICQ